MRDTTYDPPKVPNSDKSILLWLPRFVQWVSKELRRRSPDELAVDSVLLVSPSGIVYTIQVMDDGTLTSTKVQG